MVKSFIPQSLEEALKIRAEEHAIPLAGGSDLMVQHRKGTGVVPEFSAPIMIITGLKELKGIRTEDDGTVVIGALTTSAEIADSEQVPFFVRKAASLMGAISLRNSATIGGNIGNASPKGDLPQPLILLDASVVLKSISGGAHGGGTVLTPEGKEMLEKYSQFEAQVQAFAQEAFHKIFHA